VSIHTPVDLAPHIRVHVITADTFGLAKAQLAGLPVTLTVTPIDVQAETKLQFISLGADAIVAIGNGRNDHKMSTAAALGIALLQDGAAETLAGADVVGTNALDALELLRNPRCLVGTLRS
jgi:soluble P-type ATPase